MAHLRPHSEVTWGERRERRGERDRRNQNRVLLELGPGSGLGFAGSFLIGEFTEINHDF